ncbi:MAG: hypothetical protein J6386_10325 [Candidatus Synoicihabitans palmerolidicus]|nr:hypothetical protein [Candidatus Synoicihabitans palmerolidicus]
MCRNQEILPVSASLFLRYLLFANLLRLWDTLYLHDGFRLFPDPHALQALPSPPSRQPLNAPTTSSLALTPF